MPINWRISREATVETITFGSPKGRARMIDDTIAVPVPPPSPITPSSLPSSRRRLARIVPPSSIAFTALARSFFAISSCRLALAACARSSLVMSGMNGGFSRVPISMVIGCTPRPCAQSRTNSVSLPLVSRVAMISRRFCIFTPKS